MGRLGEGAADRLPALSQPEQHSWDEAAVAHTGGMSGDTGWRRPVKRVVENFAKRGAAKPRTLKRLASSIKDLLGAQTSDEAIEKLIRELEARGIVKVTESRVSYPDAAAGAG